MKIKDIKDYSYLTSENIKTDILSHLNKLHKNDEWYIGILKENQKDINLVVKEYEFYFFVKSDYEVLDKVKNIIQKKYMLNDYNEQYGIDLESFLDYTILFVGKTLNPIQGTLDNTL